MPSYLYYNHNGKQVKRDTAIGCLTAGNRVKIEFGMAELTITRGQDGLIDSKCPDHNASCCVKTPLRAIEWAEGHLRQAHQ